MKNETSGKQGKILSDKELEKVTGGDKRETFSRLREMLGHGSTPYCEGAVSTNLNNAGTEGYSRQAVHQDAISPTGPTIPTIPTSPHSTYDAYLSLMKQLFESGAISEEVYAEWESMAMVDFHQITQPAAEEILANLLAQEQNAMKNFPPADGEPETVSGK